MKWHPVDRHKSTRFLRQADAEYVCNIVNGVERLKGSGHSYKVEKIDLSTISRTNITYALTDIKDCLNRLYVEAEDIPTREVDYVFTNVNKCVGG